MKALISFILLFCVTFTVFPQANWQSSYVNWYQNINDVQFFDANTGWIALQKVPSGDWPRVLKTNNRGVNWTQVWCEDRNYYPAIYFISESVGFVFIDNVIKKTVNGGSSWEVKHTFGQSSEERRIKFVNSSTGYALFNKGRSPAGVTIYKTTDGGENWFIPHSSYDNFNSNTYLYSRLSDIDFSLTDPNNSCITSYSQNNLGTWGSGGLISTTGFSTTYGAQIHFTTNPSSNNLKHVQYVYDPNNPTDNWRFSGYRGVYKYDNDFYGVLISPDYLNAELGLSFSNYNLGFCAGYGGIWSTTNSGYNWTNEFDNASSVLTDSRMQSFGDVCYIGSQNGNFMYRKFPMNLNTNFDWQVNLYNGSFIIDGTPYTTPQDNVNLRGGTSMLGTNNNRFLISYPDTTAFFYYWGGNRGNGSTDYYNNPNYFINVGELNADYKLHLKSNIPGAINTASQTKSIVDENGVINTVYESMQGIFYTRTYNNGGKFKNEEYLSVTDPNLTYGYVTYANSNPFIAEIKPLGAGINIEPEKNVAATWEQRNETNIEIKYSERSILSTWFPWYTEQQAVTISNAPGDFKTYPKLFVAKNPGSNPVMYFRLITYLRPAAGGSTEIVVTAKKYLSGEQTRDFVIDAGNIPTYAVTASYISYAETSYDLHFAYMKNGRLWYKHTKINADPQIGLIEIPYSGQNEYKDLSDLDILQYRGEPDITLRNASNVPGTPNMQPVVTFKGQYNVIIKIDNGDGIPTPVNYTYYPVVVRERMSSGNWAQANFQYNSNVIQLSPNIEGSKNRDSYIMNFKRSSTYHQKVVKWEGSMSSGYNCNPCAYNGTDAKLVRGGLLNQYPQTQKLLKLGNSSPPYDLGIQSFEITTNLCKRDDLTDEVNGTVINDNIKYSFNLGSIMVNSQMIGFDDEIDTTIGDGEELNEQLVSMPFLLNDNDTLIIGRNASYIDEGDGNFTEVQYTVYLTNNSTDEKFLELARDTVHAGDTIQVEYLEGFIIQNIPQGSDSFYVQMEIDTLWAGDGDDFGLNNISNDEGEGDNTAMKRYVFWKNANVVTNNIPTAFNLYQNFPNPFNPLTKIKYDLPKNVNVTVKVYDLIGREVAVLVNNEFKTAGRYEINWNAINFASGVYIYRIQAGDYVSTKKMVLVK